MMARTATEEAYWLALSLKHETFEAEKIAEVHERLGTLIELWNSPVARLKRFGFSDRALSEFERLRMTVDLQVLSRQVEQLRTSGIQMITYLDSRYPQLLRDLRGRLDGAPLVLFHRGQLVDFRRCVAIVGTRNLSFHGYLMARRFAKAIAARGFIVVSGLARGTDATAHRAAMEARGGRTVAVLPWIEPIYPPEHEQLVRDIQRRGAILSESYRRRNERQAASDFVLRNRVTSGMSLCLVAIESGEEGGTMHQVRIATTQGRHVFAVKPQMVHSHIVKGYRSLVKLGAVSVSSPRQVLEFLTKQEPEGLMDRFIDRPANRF